MAGHRHSWDCNLPELNSAITPSCLSSTPPTTLKRNLIVPLLQQAQTPLLHPPAPAQPPASSPRACSARGAALMAATMREKMITLPSTAWLAAWASVDGSGGPPGPARIILCKVTSSQAHSHCSSFLPRQLSEVLFLLAELILIKQQLNVDRPNPVPQMTEKSTAGKQFSIHTFLNTRSCS